MEYDRPVKRDQPPVNHNIIKDRKYKKSEIPNICA